MALQSEEAEDLFTRDEVKTIHHMWQGYIDEHPDEDERMSFDGHFH